MLAALLYFLVGCLVIGVVLYVAHLVLGMTHLPPQVKQIAYVVIGLIALVALVMLALSVFPIPGRAFL